MTSKTKQYLGLIIIALLALIPVVIWGLLRPLPFRFNGYANTFTSLGQVAGLVGMALFCLNLIMSARLKILEPFFGGLNRMYINHHFLGSLSFILLLCHPLFLAYTYATISLKAAAVFLLPGWDVYEQLFGSIALGGMIVILILTYYVKLPYHIWKVTHRMMALVFISAILHIFMIGSDIGQSVFLKGYMFFLVALGGLSIVYRSVFPQWLVPRFMYRVVGIAQQGPVAEVSLEPVKDHLSFTPGQFAFVSFRDRTVSAEEHPFTIVSAPQEKTLRLSIKDMGDFTKKIPQLTIGALAKIEGPFGEFTMQKYPARDYTWIAGGIGITPFMSMARGFTGKEKNINIALYYCVNSPEEAIFWEELKKIMQRIPFFTAIPFYSKEQGRITASFIAEKQNVAQSQIFLCGPVPMMRSLRQQFQQLGVKSQNLHSEEFAL